MRFSALSSSHSRPKRLDSVQCDKDKCPRLFSLSLSLFLSFPSFLATQLASISLLPPRSKPLSLFLFLSSSDQAYQTSSTSSTLSLSIFHAIAVSFLSHARVLSLAMRYGSLRPSLYNSPSHSRIHRVSLFDTKAVHPIALARITVAHAIQSCSSSSSLLSVYLCATHEMEMRRWKSTITDATATTARRPRAVVASRMMHARARARARASDSIRASTTSRCDATRHARSATARDDRVHTNCAAHPELSYIVPYYAFEISLGDRGARAPNERRFDTRAPPDGPYRSRVPDSSGGVRFASPNNLLPHRFSVSVYR